jgi:ppGpp synthetase/RelA/SpoT-type nucleotidyltranferase
LGKTTSTCGIKARISFGKCIFCPADIDQRTPADDACAQTAETKIEILEIDEFVTSTPITISQLNKIGERLRKGVETENDLKSLDDFRLSFQPAYDQVFTELNNLHLNPVGRQAKTTPSIRAKLDREKTRLSRMQDIAGCRVVVDTAPVQAKVVNDLRQRWPAAAMDDRRVKPSHGYRAVHLIVYVDDHPVEVQIRTSIQHHWASISEKLSDTIDPQIKYGGGPDQIVKSLSTMTKTIAGLEIAELIFAEIGPGVSLLTQEQMQRLESTTKKASSFERFSTIFPDMKNAPLPAILSRTNELIDDLRGEINKMLREFLIKLTI